MEFLAGSVPSRDELVALYDSVGWTAYTDDPERLERAVANSTYVVTVREKGDLVALARCVSDDESIAYLQDLLVRPDFQRQGVGWALLVRVLDRFTHVRQMVLLTDDDEGQHRFYASFGFHDVASLARSPIHAFVRMEGVGRD